MGRSNTFFVLFALLAAPGADSLAAQAPPASALECHTAKSKEVDTPKELMDSMGLQFDDPCPELDKVADSGCKKIVKDLDEELKRFLTAHKAACKMIREEAACTNATCQKQATERSKEANKYEKEEQAAIKKALKLIQAIKEYIADDLLESASRMADDASSGNKAKEEKVKKAAKAGSADEVKKGGNFLGNMTSQQIRDLMQQVKGRDLPKQNVSSISGAMVKEPVEVAQVAQTLEDQLEKRQQTLNKISATNNKHAAATTKNETNANSVGSNVGGSSGSTTPESSTNAGSMAGLAGPAASMAGGAGGGGAGAGSDASGSTPYSQDYAAYNPSASGGTAGGAGDGDGGSYYGSKSGGGGGTGYSGSGSGGSLADNSKSQSPSGSVIDDGKKFAALQPGLEGPLGNSSAASSSPYGQSLKDSLRARLNSAGDDSGGGASVASTGGSAGGGDSRGGSSGASAGAATAAFNSPQASDILANSGAGGDSLGADNFSLAGSETDAFVQTMMNDLSGGTSEGDRGLASLSENQGAEILAEDSASLFSRTRETHNRCVKKGLLLMNVRARL